MPSIFYLSYFVLWIFALVEGILLFLVYRHFGLASLETLQGVSRDGLSPGDVAPSFRSIDAHKEEREWLPQPGRSSLLAFVSPTCTPCQKVLPILLSFAALQREVELVLIVSGPYVLLEKLINEFHLPPSVICFSNEGKGIYELYRVRAMPFAFIVGPDGHIRAKTLCELTTLKNFFEYGGLTIPEELLEPVEQTV